MNMMSRPPFLQFERYSTHPGVYVMKASNGHVLYVGKAKNLRQRIRQYFVPGGDGRLMIPFLVNKVDSIETILVNSEKEALLLENNLIKRYQPPYNALLKDDKSYIALKITKKMWPTLELARYRGHPPKDGLFFGPYTSANAARTTLEWMRRLFPMRQCSDQEFAKRKRPCILYGMKRCPAPCVGLCSQEAYERNVQNVIKFLRGQDKELVNDLIKEMEQCSEQLKFEQAADLLRTIKQIEQTIEVQRVDKPIGIDIDAIGIYREAESVVVSQLIFRGGKLIGSRFHVFKQIAQEDPELLESFLLQQYEGESEIPHEILLPCELEAKALEELLAGLAHRKVSIFMPQRGEKKALLEMAYKNAQAAFNQEYDTQALREKTLIEMQELLHLTRYPGRVECFDTSNTSGSYPVAAMVSFLEGEKETKGYRTYVMKTLSEDAPDDYGAMREVLLRRYRKAKEENKLPDLVIVDGGRGHLNVALKVFSELDISTVDVIGLAKEDGRHDKGSTAEQIFLPERKDPLLLRKNSSVLFLLQQIRDESHRFVLTFHRKRHSKGTLRSSLETIPGIGPAKRKALLIHFGSIKKLLEADRKALAEVPGLSQANMTALEEYIHSKRHPKENIAKLMTEEEIVEA